MHARFRSKRPARRRAPKPEPLVLFEAVVDPGLQAEQPVTRQRLERYESQGAGDGWAIPMVALIEPDTHAVNQLADQRIARANAGRMGGDSAPPLGWLGMARDDSLGARHDVVHASPPNASPNDRIANVMGVIVDSLLLVYRLDTDRLAPAARDPILGDARAWVADCSATTTRRLHSCL